MLEELTERQREIFKFIAAGCLKKRPPTLREIMAEFGMVSTEGARCNLRAIVSKGWLELTPNKARAIRLTKAARDSLRMPLLDVATITRLARTGRW